MLSHSEILEGDLAWLERVIRTRIEFPKADLRNFEIEKFTSAPDNSYLSVKSRIEDYNLIPPSLHGQFSKYADIVGGMSFEGRLMVILALSIHIYPGLIESIISKPRIKSIIEKEPAFFQISGLTQRTNSGLIPTGRFYIYLISGINIDLKTRIISQIAQKTLEPITQGLIGIFKSEGSIFEPIFNGELFINEEDILLMMTNNDYKLTQAK